MTSREIETIVGMIMIARMTLAAKIPTPKVGPAKNGMYWPIVLAIQSSTVFRNVGLRTKTPHRPMTTLGIAASSSIRKLTGTAIRRSASSARKIAVSSPRGAAKSRARSDVISVPTMNGSAP